MTGLLLVTLVAVVLLVALHDGEDDPRLQTRLVSDCSGAITDWLLGLPDGDAVFFAETQAAVVAKAAPGIHVHVYYADDAQRAGLEAALRDLGGRDAEHLHWHKAERGVWPWMRDLFLAAQTPDGAPVTLLQRPEAYARRWSARALRAVAGSLKRGRYVQTDAAIEGGVLVVDDDRVLACASALPGPALERVRTHGGLPVELLPVRDAHGSRHCDLVLMPAGERRIVVASPALGARLLRRAGGDERARFEVSYRGIAERAAPGHALRERRDLDVLGAMAARNARPQVERSFAAVRARLAALGYAVHVVPQLGLEPHDAGLWACFSYVNVVIDERDGRRTVYLPTYRLPTLDAHAADVWRRLGYRVVPIDCLAPALSGGGLHCLSQVFRSRR